MADQSTYADTKEGSSHSNKRKRHSMDRDALAERHGGDLSSRSNYPRVPSSGGAGNSNPPGDIVESAASYLQSANPAGPDEDGIPQSGNASIDFAALVQHNASEPDSHNLHINGGPNRSNASDTAAAALSHYSMTVPQPTELNYQAPRGSDEEEDDRQLTNSYTADDDHHSHHPHHPHHPHHLQHHHQHPQHHHHPHHHDASAQSPEHGLAEFSLEAALKASADVESQMAIANDGHAGGPEVAGLKPPVGSTEWNKIRKDNHKEVERRRRETINEGINELAKIVPGCEKNKGSILQRAVQFITQLKENEAQNIEKWTLEKLLTEQAIAELSASCDKFKADFQRAQAEAAAWKAAAQAAGITDARAGGDTPAKAVDGAQTD